MTPSIRLLVGVAFAVAAASFAVAGPAQAARTPAAAASPAAGASASASPAASPTATPDPPDIAIPKLEAKLKVDPTDRASQAELAQNYLQVGRPDATLAITQKMLNSGTKNAQVYYLDGVANASLGRIPQATSDFEQASNLEPTNALVLSTLTSLYLKTNRVADADRVARRAITFNKESPDVYLNYGNVLEAQQKYDDARKEYEQAAQLEPKAVGPVILQARTYLAQNAIALASQLYDRALTIDPNSTDAIYGKARILAQQHDVTNAIPLYEKLIKLSPDPAAQSAVVDEEASLYANEKMDAQAEAAFKRAISDFGNQPNAHVAYGDYLMFKKQNQQGEAEWTQGLGPQKDNPQALARLGRYYAEQKQWSKATDMFKRLVAVNPTDAEAAANLAQLQMQNKDYNGARDAYRRAFDLTRSPQMLAGLGEADLAARNYKEGVQVFEALDKNAPDFVKQNPAIVFLLGQAYKGDNQKDKARSTFTRFLAMVPKDSQAASQVKKLIADLGPAAAPKK